MSGRDGPTWDDDMDTREEGRKQESYMDGLWLTRGGGSMGRPPPKGGGCGTTLAALAVAGLTVAVAW